LVYSAYKFKETRTTIINDEAMVVSLSYGPPSMTKDKVLPQGYEPGTAAIKKFRRRTNVDIQVRGFRFTRLSGSSSDYHFSWHSAEKTVSELNSNFTGAESYPSFTGGHVNYI